MDLFPDGGFVRLQSRVSGKYVHADGDWVKISLRPNGAVPSLNAVWRVEHWFSEAQGVTFILLQNAAYGRYLSFSLRKAKAGHRGFLTTQLDRDEPHELYAHPWMWTAERPVSGEDYVSLRYFNCYLRANGRYLTWNWNILVTADVDPDAPAVSDMMHWEVHQVPACPVPQPLPITHQGDDAQLRPYLPRTIRHVRANDEREFDQNHNNWPWPYFAFYDSCLFGLKTELGQLQEDWEGDISAFTLCMRPGSHGRLMPLVTDPPRSLDSLNIVVFRTGSPAAVALLYPAPPPAADAVAA